MAAVHIKAILLDLGRVIVPFDFGIGYSAIQAKCGLPPEEIRERIRATGLVPQFETGVIEPEPFVDRLCKSIGVEFSFGEFSDIWSSIFAKETLIPELFISNLHRGYRLVLVSNTNAIHFEMIRANYPLLGHFDAFVLSYEVGAMKPARTIFEAALEAAQCSPEECFFTDDIPEYVDAARQLGIYAEVFESFEKLKTDLQSLGVIIEPIRRNDQESLSGKINKEA